MFATATQSLSEIDSIKMASLSPPLAEAGPQPSATTSQTNSTEKLSALDTLSLAASAALNQRDPKQVAVSTGAGATPLPSFASSEQRSNTASHEPISPSAQSATSSLSNGNTSSNNLALLCGEAASKNPEHITNNSIHNKYTTSSAPNHNLFSQQQQMQPSTPDDSEFISPGLRAGSGSPTSSTLQFPSNSTLPNLSTLLPHHPLPMVSSTTPPASTPDLADSRWNYQKPQQQQQKHHLSPNASAGNNSLLSQPENPIHPQLAALSGLNANNGSAGSNNYDTFSSTNGGNTYSPMSIASLTTPMYSSNASNNNNSSNPINGNKDHTMLLPKDGQEHPNNKRKFYSGIMETSFDSNNSNIVKSNNTNTNDDMANSINALNNTNNSNIQSNNNNSSSARKKRQCTQCNGWFSNLATHKSTHLADNSRPHTCEVCNRGFARPNDLFRHSKSHRGDAPFRCPLFVRGPLPNHAFGNLELSCHQNGGFSRCDTYKNHLKAMHFEYPPGTKKKQRNGMKGNCKACGMSFPSSDVWITEHIDPGNCAVIKQIKALKESNQLWVRV